MPRWVGDTNFMPVMSDTRVVPETLLDTYDLLLEKFNPKADATQMTKLETPKDPRNLEA